MPAPERSVQTFVLRVWQEHSPGDGPRPTWRGHITDVATGERRYVETIDAVVAFLLPRLELLGERAGLRRRLSRWIARRRSERS